MKSADVRDPILIAQDIADLLDLVWSAPSAQAAATAARVIDRHDAARTCMKLSEASRLLQASVPTVTTWLERGALEGVDGFRVRCVSVSSVGWALSALRRQADPSDTRGKLARVLESLSDRETLRRARRLLSDTHEDDLVTLSPKDMAKLRSSK